jgi:ATP/maltotriose-dependent transcriptional regulator MalT
MTSDGVVRLAELRRRQGRLVEAAALFDQAEPHPLAALGRAELAFDRGDARAAAEQAERYLRRVLPHNRTDRATGLDLLVRALVSAGEIDGAKTALAELSAIAVLVGTVPMKAAASLAGGYVAAAGDQVDIARRHLEDAVDLFVRCSAPYELARVLASTGRMEAARAEAQRAVDLLTELKAELDLSRARALIDSLATHDLPERGDKPRVADNAGLTARELEVLRLVAEGLNNQHIGERLFLSEHTVHRHVANIFTKLSVSSRAAAVAQAARRGLLA